MSAQARSARSPLQAVAQIAIALTPLSLLAFVPRGATPAIEARDLVQLLLLGLAAFGLSAALDSRRGTAAARAYLVAGLTGGVLILLGPFGTATVAVLIFLVSVESERSGRPAAERRADLLTIAFVPALTLAGLLFAGWSLTGAGPFGLVRDILRGARGNILESPWLAHFGGGAPSSWPLLIGTAVLCCPWLVSAARDGRARAAALVATSGVLAAGFLTALDLFDSPLALAALVAGAGLGALRERPPRRQRHAIASTALGVALAATVLLPLAPRGSSTSLAWTLAPRIDEPPAWGVAAAARDRFALETGLRLDASRRP